MLESSCCNIFAAAAVALVWKSMSVAAWQQKRDSHSHRHIDSSSQSSRGRGEARQAWLAHQLVWHKATAKAVCVCVCGGSTCLAFLGYPNLALPRPRPNTRSLHVISSVNCVRCRRRCTSPSPLSLSLLLLCRCRCPCRCIPFVPPDDLQRL